MHQGNVICKFEGVDSIEAAQAYKGRIVYTDKDAQALAPGEYYIADVIGLAVVDADTGAPYGRLTDVYQAPANDAYEIELASGKRVLFPAIRDVVIETDIEGRRDAGAADCGDVRHMKFSIMTLFPEYMDFLLGQSIIGRARKAAYLK